MAQLGQHPVLEPAQQGRAFAVRASVGIAGHYGLHPGPVLHGGADIGQGRLQGALQFAAVACVGAAGFDIDHRFALFARSFARHDLGQAAFRIPADRDDRVDQAVDRQALRGNRGGNGIDQERHVVVDQGEAHEAFTGRA